MDAIPGTPPDPAVSTGQVEKPSARPGGAGPPTSSGDPSGDPGPVKPRGEISRGEWLDGSRVPSPGRFVEQVTPLAAGSLVEEGGGIPPLVPIAPGHGHLGARSHLVEGRRSDQAGPDVLRHLDLEVVREAAH